MPSAEKCAGKKRHDHRRDVQLARDRDGVQRAGAAGGDEREVARIVALLDRDLAHRERHVRDRDLGRSPSAASTTSMPSVVGDLVLDGLRRAPPRRAASRRRGSYRRPMPAEHHVGVRDRRLRAAAAVADRAGIGAGALRPDLQPPTSSIHAMLPPPAPTSTMSITGQHHRMAARIAADVVALRHA